MPEFIDRDGLEPDEQLEISPYMIALIESFADQVGYILPDGKPTKRTRFELALEMDNYGVDPLHTATVLSGRRLGIDDRELVMLAYAYSHGKLSRKDFFSKFVVEADLLMMLD